MPSKPYQLPLTDRSRSGDRTSYPKSHIARPRSPYRPYPPTAYCQQSLHSQAQAAPILYVLSPRQPGSVFSNGTPSSTRSTSEINRLSSLSQYYMASHAEQGHISATKPGNTDTLAPIATHRSMSDTGRKTRDDNSAVFRYIQEQEAQPPEDDHALSVLAFLSTLDPLYSAFTAFWSILVGLVFLICSPISICNKSFSPGDSIVRSLAPLLKKHLQFIHAESVPTLHTLAFSPAKLVLVNAISPLLSIGIALLAWVAASFWLFALMMGNPDGTERDDDGRSTVLRLRNWWEKFLLSSAQGR